MPPSGMMGVLVSAMAPDAGGDKHGECLVFLATTTQKERGLNPLLLLPALTLIIAAITTLLTTTRLAITTTLWLALLFVTHVNSPLNREIPHYDRPTAKENQQKKGLPFVTHIAIMATSTEGETEMTNLHDAHVVEYRDVLAGSYWDFHKEVHGIKPRWMPVDEMSIQELLEELAILDRVASSMMEVERMYEALEGKRHYSELGWEPEPMPINNPFVAALKAA